METWSKPVVRWWLNFDPQPCDGGPPKKGSQNGMVNGTRELLHQRRKGILHNQVTWFAFGSATQLFRLAWSGSNKRTELLRFTIKLSGTQEVSFKNTRHFASRVPIFGGKVKAGGNKDLVMVVFRTHPFVFWSRQSTLKQPHEFHESNGWLYCLQVKSKTN